MTLMEHLRELRTRLFRACLAILIGTIAAWWLANPVVEYIGEPYCSLMANRAIQESVTHALPVGWKCPFVQLGVTDVLLLKLKVALWVGLIIASPVWLYQLWAFIAPGLHRNERRWAYLFGGLAAPLFAAGAYLSFVVVSEGLVFLLDMTGPEITTQLEITRYVDFVTGMMLVFGLAFEFPLGVMLANIAGIVTGKRLLGWWRVAVFITFIFAAIATPTADPFGMTALALALSSLYFAAVGFATFNDRRRRRKQPSYAGIGDDEVSSLDDYDVEPVEAATPIGSYDPIDAPAPVAAPTPIERPKPLERGFDDIT
ncbi:twin-arginine translocase subunit TatC [Dactylosporangium sp. NPDC051484]|uniref:twin-arginine translocase subunit TatC n=1 Tax=Dactylosporangium sp. NPDC051484 TaxID=3154942 RepID=UPI00345081CC